MRHFWQGLQVTCNQRTTVFRLSHSQGRTRTIILLPPWLEQQRHCSHNAPRGYPPMPPPPPAGYAHGSPYYYYGQYAAPAPPSGKIYTQGGPQLSSEIGTMEKPLVVMSAPQKSSWASRFWMLLLLAIGITCFLNLVDEMTARYQEMTIGTHSPGDVSRSSLSQMVGGNEVKPVNLNDLETTFESVRGCDEAKKELEEVVEFLKDPKKFHDLGGRLPKGALLVGPPGCGKTLLAKAIAKEAGVSFFYATGSEFDEMFVGVGSRRVRELFAAAKAHAPALIFIDEIDALGGKRSRADHSYSRMTLNQLLAEMDGFRTKESIIVLAATNTPESLDKALTRPGRLDTVIAVDPPDMKGRAEVVQMYLDKVKVDSSVSAMDVARGTSGFTGAELSNLVNMAAIRAAVLNKSSVTSSEIEYAKDRVMMGAESSKVIPEEERRITAFHEGGHALTAILLKDEGAEPVHKATIVPRGNGIMGLVQQLPERDRYSQSKRQCLARLKVCVAGRVGEEMLLGHEDITTGAGSDFQQATKMARNMVRRFGFSDSMGFVDYESADTAEGAYMSDDTKQKIEMEVQNLVHQAYVETKQLLAENQEKLVMIAQNLLRYETLSGDDLNKLLKGESIPPREPRSSTNSKPKPPSDSDGASRGNRRPVTIS